MASTIPAEDKLDFKKILPLFIIILVDLLGLTIIIPLLPLYAASFGADELTIGLLGTAFPLMQLIGAPMLGSLSDRFGRKPILLLSQIGTFLGFILLGLANTLPLLFLARAIDGLSGANVAVAQAALTDSTSEKTRSQGLGLLGAAFGLGFIIGPVIAFASLGLSGNDYHVPAFVAAGFSLLSIILTSFWFKETLHGDKRSTHESRKTAGGTITRVVSALRNPSVSFLLVLLFFQQLIFGGFEFLVALFTLNRLGLNGSGNAVIFVFVGIIIVMVQGYYIGKWTRQYGERKLIFAALLLLGFGLIVTAVTPYQAVAWYSRSEMVKELTQNQTVTSDTSAAADLSIPIPEDGNNGWLGLGWMLAAMIPVAVGGGLLQPSINSLITQRVSKEGVGGTLGVSSALTSSANAIMPLVGGTLFKVLGYTAPFLFGGVFLLALFAIALRLLRETKPSG